MDHSFRSEAGPAAQPSGLVSQAARLASVAGLPPARVEVVESIDSTNRELMRRPPILDAGASQACELLLAHRQLAGRGRRGRIWLSDPQDSLTFSVAIEHRRDSATPPLSGLSLAIGAAVAETLEPLTGGLGLKWPNDLMRHGRKCAGILIETRLGGDRERIVVGLGINLFVPESLAQVLDQPACGLFDADAVRPDPIELAGRLAHALIAATEQFVRVGFAQTPARWARFDLLAGREITILEEGRPKLKGIADGLAPGGELRVRTVEGLVCVAVGDVSARLGDLTVGSGAAP